MKLQKPYVKHPAVAVVAIVCLTVIEIVALTVAHIDGALFGIIVAAIGGISGYLVRNGQERKNHP